MCVSVHVLLLCVCPHHSAGAVKVVVNQSDPIVRGLISSVHCLAGVARNSIVHLTLSTTHTSLQKNLVNAHHTLVGLYVLL